MQDGVSVCSIPCRSSRLVLVAAQCPCNRIQYGGFALVVVAADDGQTVCRRFQLHRLDSLNIFDFQTVDFHAHFSSSRCSCSSSHWLLCRRHATQTQKSAIAMPPKIIVCMFFCLLFYPFSCSVRRLKAACPLASYRIGCKAQRLAMPL